MPRRRRRRRRPNNGPVFSVKADGRGRGRTQGAHAFTATAAGAMLQSRGGWARHLFAVGRSVEGGREGAWREEDDNERAF